MTRRPTVLFENGNHFCGYSAGDKSSCRISGALPKYPESDVRLSKSIARPLPHQPVSASRISLEIRRGILIDGDGVQASSCIRIVFCNTNTYYCSNLCCRRYFSSASDKRCLAGVHERKRVGVAGRGCLAFPCAPG
jgi:hypothetical protein